MGLGSYSVRFFLASTYVVRFGAHARRKLGGRAGGRQAGGGKTARAVRQRRPRVRAIERK